MINFNNDGIKVAEFCKDDAVVEVYEKVKDKTYFNVVCCAVATGRIIRELSLSILSTQMSALIISVTRAMEYIAEQHKKLRKDQDAIIQNKNEHDWKTQYYLEIQGGKKFVEFRRNSVVVEVYSGEDKLFIRCCREFIFEGERKKSIILYQKDLRDLIAAIAESEIFINNFNKGKASSSDGNITGIEGGYYQS